MSRGDVGALARTLLYEGYLLYPYRPSAVKNRQRFNFGVIYPDAHSRAQDGVEPSLMRTECLVVGPTPTVDIEVRFLHLVTRTVEQPTEGGAGAREVARLEAGGRVYQPWQEAVEREVTLSRLALSDLLGSIHRRRVAFPDTDQREPISGSSGDPVGVVRRRQAGIELEIEVAVRPAGDDAYVIGVEIDNRTERVPSPALRDELLSVCLVAVHTILTVESGEFTSLIDPPAALREATAQCRNVGTWPVLAGPPGTRDTMLSSPIILYDYPEIAPESRGDLFDGTEIDEILSLRIMTLSDDEKREIAESDEHARLLLERTESLAAEELMGLHGTMRPVRARDGA